MVRRGRKADNRQRERVKLHPAKKSWHTQSCVKNVYTYSDPWNIMVVLKIRRIHEEGLANFSHGISLRISIIWKSNNTFFVMLMPSVFLGHYLSPHQTPAQSRTLLSRWMVSNKYFSFSLKNVYEQMWERGHKQERPFNKQKVCCNL